MNRTIFLVFALVFSISAFSQDITGQWNGALKVQGMQLRIVFNIEKVGAEYKSTMGSPDQGIKGVPCDETSFSDNLLKIRC